MKLIIGLVFTIIISVGLSFQAQAKKSSIWYIVTATPHVSVRIKPSITGKIIGKLDKGSIVKLIRFVGKKQSIGGYKSRWAKIEFKNKKSAYVFGAYLKKYSKKHNKNSSFGKFSYYYENAGIASEEFEYDQAIYFYTKAFDVAKRKREKIKALGGLVVAYENNDEPSKARAALRALLKMTLEINGHLIKFNPNLIKISALKP